jgi:hypothetical protein
MTKKVTVKVASQMSARLSAVSSFEKHEAIAENELKYKDEKFRPLLQILSTFRHKQHVHCTVKDFILLHDTCAAATRLVFSSWAHS